MNPLGHSKSPIHVVSQLGENLVVKKADSSEGSRERGIRKRISRISAVNLGLSVSRVPDAIFFECHSDLRFMQAHHYIGQLAVETNMPGRGMRPCVLDGRGEVTFEHFFHRLTHQQGVRHNARVNEEGFIFGGLRKRPSESTEFSSN